LLARALDFSAMSARADARSVSMSICGAVAPFAPASFSRLRMSFA
jgi:hypothetical protein